MHQMTRIEPPAWAYPFHRSVDDSFEETHLSAILDMRDALLAVVHDAVQGYIDDDSLTFDAETDGFPSRDRLTGEYYIGAEHFGVQDEPWIQRVGRKRTHTFSFEVRCLEHRRTENQQDLDYLGLEVHFIWDPVSATFTSHGDIDSSAI